MASLRDEILGVTPSGHRFAMLLPPGWEAHDLSEEDVAAVMQRASLRLAHAHRPDLLATLREYVRRAASALVSQNAVAYAFAGEASPTWALGSASLIATVRSSSDQLPLDAVVRNAISNHGAVPLGDTLSVVRWVERRPVELEGEELDSTMINYLIPVPGTRRSRALQWTVTVPHARDLPENDRRLATWVALFDGHIATFQWQAAA